MLFLMWDLPLWSLLLPSALVGLYYYLTRNYDYFDKMGVSYPAPWPVIGNVLDFLSVPLPETHKRYSEKYGKVFGLFTGSTPILNVSDAEIIKEVAVKQFSKFTDRRPNGFNIGVFERTLPNLRSDHWKHVRSQLTGSFTSGKLKQMQVLIDQNVEDFMRNLGETCGKPVGIKDYTTAYTLDVIASTAFGMMVDSQKNPDDPFLRHARKIFDFNITSNPLVPVVFMFPKLGKYLDKIGLSVLSKTSSDYFSGALQQNFAGMNMEDRKDFISIALKKLVDLEKIPADSIRHTDGLQWTTSGLLEPEVLCNAVIFFLAGFETTATLLQYACYSLATHTNVMERLRAEVVEQAGGRESVATYEELSKMEYLDWVLNETLRMYPPAVMSDRICCEETTVKGIRIPKGCAVNFLIHQVHHDPEYWPQPETFFPERFDPANKPENFQYIFLPFGVGPRNCIGMRLALLEAKAALARIVQKFDIELASEAPKGPLKMKSGLGLLSPKTPIMLRMHPVSQK